jgi:hypothetical protein
MLTFSKYYPNTPSGAKGPYDVLNLIFFPENIVYTKRYRLYLKRADYKAPINRQL